MTDTVSLPNLITRLATILLFVMLAGPAAAGPAAAQSGAADRGEARASTGRILGQVLSRETGAPLPGARIEVEGAHGTAAVMAGVEGMFRVRDVPAGVVTVRFSLIGHATRVVTGVQVPEGGTLRLDAVLERRAVQMSEIVVDAERERGSAASMLDEQRRAPAVVSAISAEQMARSPDGNAAAAIRRVSGVTVQDGRHVFVRGLGERYTTSSLNGTRIPSPDPERKSVPLDLFPAGLLESITTSKTFTPDRPGDFSGGAVDLRTARFPRSRTVRLSLSTGFHPEITGRPIPGGRTEGGEWLALGARERAIPGAALDFSGTRTRGDEVNEVINSFRNVWSARRTTARAPISGSVSAGGSGEMAGHVVGGIASLTYSNGQSARLDQRRARVGTGATEIDRYDGSEGATSVLWGGMVNVGALIGTHSQIHLSNTLNRSADHRARVESGVDENTRAHVRIDRLTYVERLVRSHRLNGMHQLGSRHSVDWSLSRSVVSRSEPDRSEFVTWLDPETPIWFKDFEGAVRTFGSLDEGAWEGDASYGLRFGGEHGRAHQIRTGGMFRTTERDAWSQGFRMQPFDWSPTDPRWQLPPEQIFDGRYSGEGDDLILLSRELAGGSYRARDRLAGGFLLADLRLRDWLRMIAGARIEDYRLEVDSESQLGQPESTTKRYTDVLPAAVLTFELPGEHQVRVAAARTLARPEYREVAPITYREVLGGEQVIGNLELERTLIDNLDLRCEWYPRPGETLSIGFFGKWFDRPIEQRYLARSGTNTLTFVNAESATNFGVELEVGQRLDRLHEALAPLTLFGNLTVMRSRVRVDETGEGDRAMVGQAPWVVNVGLHWDHPHDGATATVQYNVVGARIVNARPSGTQVEDVIERPRHELDISVRLPLLAGVSGRIDLKNLLDAPHEVVQGPIVREYHRTGRSVSVGLSWRP